MRLIREARKPQVDNGSQYVPSRVAATSAGTAMARCNSVLEAEFVGGRSDVG